MLCPTCHQETPHNAYCGNCGAPLSELSPNPYQTGAAFEPVQKSNAWAGIVAMITGGLSVLACVSVYGGFLLGLAAIVFGIIGAKSENRGLAIGGIVCGAAGILFSILAVFLAFGLMTSVFHGISGRPEMQRYPF